MVVPTSCAPPIYVCVRFDEILFGCYHRFRQLSGTAIRYHRVVTMPSGGVGGYSTRLPARLSYGRPCGLRALRAALITEEI